MNVKYDAERIDVYLANETDMTRSEIQKKIEAGSVLLNGEPTKKNVPVFCGDVIDIAHDTKNAKLEPEKIPLNVLFEDPYLAVVNKPRGMLTQPTESERTGTLANALLGRFPDLSIYQGEDRPGIVHRLDRDTTGLLVIAKNDAVHAALSKAFEERKVRRIYRAIVHGVVPFDRLLCDRSFGRDRKNRTRMSINSDTLREASTTIRTLERFQESTLIEAELHTGRTHQIRFHMEFLGYPIVGDPVYYRGSKKRAFDKKLPGQMLHCYEIGFLHPITHEEVAFTTEPDEVFLTCLKEVS